MLINEIENEITNVLLRSDVYDEFVCHFVKLIVLSMKLHENEFDRLKTKLNSQK